MITHKDVEYFLLSNNWVKALEEHKDIDKYVSLNPDIEYSIHLCNNTNHSMYKSFLYQSIKSFATFTKIDEFDCLQQIANQWLPFDPGNVPEAKEGFTLLIMHPDFTFPLCFNYSLHEKDKWEEYKDYAELSGYRYPKDSGYQYKLVPLPQ